MPQHTIHSKWHHFEECIAHDRILVSTGNRYYTPNRFPFMRAQLLDFLAMQKTTPMPRYVLSNDVKTILQSEQTMETIEVLKRFNRYRLPAPISFVEFDGEDPGYRIFCFAFERSHRHHILGRTPMMPDYKFSTCAFGLLDFSNPSIYDSIMMKTKESGPRVYPKHPLFAVIFPMVSDLDTVRVPANIPVEVSSGVMQTYTPKEAVGGGICYQTFSSSWLPHLVSVDGTPLQIDRESISAESITAGAYATRALSTLMQTRGIEYDVVEKSDIAKLNKSRLNSKKPEIPSHSFVSLTKYRPAKASDKSEPTGRKQRFHLRSAHAKMQRFGPGNAQSKEIFVEAYIAGEGAHDPNAVRVVKA